MDRGIDLEDYATCIIATNVSPPEDFSGPLFSEFEIRPLTDYAKYMDGVAAALERQGR
jgi:hypothetical protein